MYIFALRYASKSSGIGDLGLCGLPLEIAILKLSDTAVSGLLGR